MAQRKETKKKVKVRDLKPKKDAKGGRVPPGGHARNALSPKVTSSPLTRVAK